MTARDILTDNLILLQQATNIICDYLSLARELLALSHRAVTAAVADRVACSVAS